MQRGQGSIEYVAFLAMLVAVLGLAGASGAAPRIVNGVGRGFQRALCSVARTGCATVDARPCTVRTAATGGEVTAKLAFARLSAQAGLLRSERSDGSVSLMLLEHLGAGVTAGVGADGRLRLGSVEVAEGAAAEASAVARLGGGRTWTVPSAAAADKLQRRLVEMLAGGAVSRLPVIGVAAGVVQKVAGIGAGRGLPPAASRVLDARAGISAAAKFPGGSRLSAAMAVGGGLTIDRVSGQRAVLLRLEGEAGGQIAGGLLGGTGGGSVSLSITYDRRGAPLELTASAAGHGAVATGVKGVGPHLLGASDGGGANVTVTSVLDLRDPFAASAVARLVRTLRPDRAAALVPAAHALGVLLATSGRVDAQRYSVRDSGVGIGAEAGLGAQVGIDAEVTRSTTRLADAWTRPPGGAWERRIDCFGK